LGAYHQKRSDLTGLFGTVLRAHIPSDEKEGGVMRRQQLLFMIQKEMKESLILIQDHFIQKLNLENIKEIMEKIQINHLNGQKGLQKL